MMDEHQVISSNKVIVGVRVRPLNEKELSCGKTPKSAWSISSTSNTISELPITPSSTTSANNTTTSASTLRTVHSYRYNVVFDESASNANVYKKLGAPIVESAIAGYNSTLISYGQTSSGKTHSMLGSSIDPGLTPLSIHHIFRDLKKHQLEEHAIHPILISYVEIYNDQLKDLLNPNAKKQLLLRDKNQSVSIIGVTEVPVITAKDTLRLLKVGQLSRRTSDTGMNSRSSRSHTIFMLRFHKGNVLHLVDLAGSERSKHTNTAGQRLKEGSFINQSLLTLGTIISKLSNANQSNQHLPYRDSKLTRLLRPALGGDSKLAILCTITPSIMYSDETTSTLKFATRASGVVNKATIKKANHLSVNYKLKYQQVEKEVTQLRLRFQELQKEMTLLRNNHVSQSIILNSTNGDVSSITPTSSDTMSTWSSDDDHDDNDEEDIHEMISSPSTPPPTKNEENEGEDKEKEDINELRDRMAHVEGENQKLRQRLLKMTVNFTMMRIQTAGLNESVKKRRRPKLNDGVHERSVMNNKSYKFENPSFSSDSESDDDEDTDISNFEHIDEINISIPQQHQQRQPQTKRKTGRTNVQVSNVTIIQRIMLDTSNAFTHASAATCTMDPGVGGATMLALALGDVFKHNAGMQPVRHQNVKTLQHSSNLPPHRALSTAVGNFVSMLRNMFINSINSL